MSRMDDTRQAVYNRISSLEWNWRQIEDSQNKNGHKKGRVKLALPFNSYFYQYPFKAFESIQNTGEKIELPYRLEAPPVSRRGREITEGA